MTGSRSPAARAWRACSRGTSAMLGLLAVLGVWLAWTSVASASERVYWADVAADNLQYANLDYSDAGYLYTFGAATGGPNGVAVDPANGRIYWANVDFNTISYANLDGSGGGSLYVGSAPVNSPYGVAIDSAGGRIYWANHLGNSIAYANLDGSGGGQLDTTGATVNEPDGVAVDPAGGRVYWASTGSDTISYASVSGGGGADLNVNGANVDDPQGVAYDPGDGRIYWANTPLDTISYARVDLAASGAALDTTGATIHGPIGVAVDPIARRVYWGNSGYDYASSASVDGGHGGSAPTPGAGSGAQFPVLIDTPVASGAPTLTGGSTIGATLSCSNGLWAPDYPSSFYYRSPFMYSYQWSLNGSTINGQSGSSIAAESSGSYRCSVIGTNSAGAVTQTSAPHTVSPAPPATPSPTPGSGPTPPAIGPTATAAFRGLTLTKQSVPLTRKGAAPIKVSCPAATYGECTGKLKLTTNIKPKIRNGQRKTITIGTISFNVTAGKHATLVVKLSKSAQARVLQARNLSASATASAKDRLGRSTTTRASITIRPHRRNAGG